MVEAGLKVVLRGLSLYRCPGIKVDFKQLEYGCRESMLVSLFVLLCGQVIFQLAEVGTGRLV